VAYASSLDQIGPITNSVADAAWLLEVMSGFDEKDNTSSQNPTVEYSKLLNTNLKGLRIGVPAEYFGEGLEPKVKQSVLAALDSLLVAGAEKVNIHLPHMEYGVSAYYLIATAEASANLSRYDGVRYSHRSKQAKNLQDLYSLSRSEGFGWEVKKRIILGTYALSSGFYDAYYLKAQKIRRLISQDFEKAFNECDIILTPTTPKFPSKLGEFQSDPMSLYLEDIYTVSLNLAGLPGISLPVPSGELFSAGVQLVGPGFGELKVLQTAFALEHILKERKN